MKKETFEQTIEKLMNVVNMLCREQGIDFLAQFIVPDEKDSKLYYHYINGDTRLSPSTIMTQYQKFGLKFDQSK